MSAQVITLPTEIAVLSSWERYASLCRRVGQNPELLNDHDFSSHINAAQAEWMNILNRWTKRQ